MSTHTFDKILVGLKATVVNSDTLLCLIVRDIKLQFWGKNPQAHLIIMRE